MTSLVTSSTRKKCSWIICIRSFNIWFQTEDISKKIKILKFSKQAICWGLCELFRQKCHRKLRCHLDSQEHYLHFELLINVLAKILTELWQFQNLTYFLISWPSYFTFDLVNKWVPSTYQDTYLVQVWWWLVKQCDLYPANNLHPDRQTERQTNRETNRQTNILAKIENFGK